jgi:hypothetical protein
MEPVSVNPIIPAALSALSPFQPAQTSVIQVTQTGSSSKAATVTAQTLTQTLFQRTLQAAAAYPIFEPAPGGTGLSQSGAASLLAVLTPAQAPVQASTQASTQAPAASEAASAVAQTQDGGTASSSASTPEVAASPTQDLPAAQDTFGTSLNPDFAMQTALRFGAGVLAQAAASVGSTPDQGTVLVRDATSVLRLGNLQAHAGGAGPEAFAQAGTPTQRVLRTYEGGSASSAAQGTGTVDLLA